MDIKYSGTITEPIALADVKLYSKIDYSEEDTLITSLITAVRERLEEFTGRSFVAKTIEAYWDYLPSEVRLPYPEHDTITEVQINGEVSTAYAQMGLNRLVVKPESIVTLGTEVVNPSLYVKYTTLGTCPEAVKIEMLRLIDEKYRNRGNTFVGSTAELSENTFANLAQYCEE